MAATSITNNAEHQVEISTCRHLKVADVTFHDFVSTDDEVTVAAGLSDSEMIASITTQNKMAGADIVNDDGHGDNENKGKENSQITSPEVHNIMQALKDILLEQLIASEADVCNGLRCLGKAGDTVVCNAIAIKQQVTTDFFK